MRSTSPLSLTPRNARSNVGWPRTGPPLRSPGLCPFQFQLCLARCLAFFDTKLCGCRERKKTQMQAMSTRVQTLEEENTNLSYTLVRLCASYCQDTIAPCLAFHYVYGKCKRLGHLYIGFEESVCVQSMRDMEVAQLREELASLNRSASGRPDDSPAGASESAALCIGLPLLIILNTSRPLSLSDTGKPTPQPCRWRSLCWWSGTSVLPFAVQPPWPAADSTSPACSQPLCAFAWSPAIPSAHGAPLADPFCRRHRGCGGANFLFPAGYMIVHICQLPAP